MARGSAKRFGELCVPLKKSWLRPWIRSGKKIQSVGKGKNLIQYRQNSSAKSLRFTRVSHSALFRTL